MPKVLQALLLKYRESAPLSASSKPPASPLCPLRLRWLAYRVLAIFKLLWAEYGAQEPESEARWTPSAKRCQRKFLSCTWKGKQVRQIRAAANLRS